MSVSLNNLLALSKAYWPEIALGVLCLLAYHQGAALALKPWPNLQWWSLFTGHLVHTNLSHLLMNLTGLGLISASFRFDIKPSQRLFVLIGLIIILGIFISATQPYVYFGLSGMLHGYLCFWLVKLWGDQRVFYSLALISIGVKVVSENIGLLNTEQTAAFIAAPVAVESHFLGALLGVCVGLIWIFIPKTLKALR